MADDIFCCDLEENWLYQFLCSSVMVMLIVMLNHKMSVFVLSSALCSHSLSDIPIRKKLFRWLFLFLLVYVFQPNLFHENIGMDPSVNIIFSFIKCLVHLKISLIYFIIFTFMHLADAFIQSDFQCIQVKHFFCQYVCSLGIEPTTFALLTQYSNHWATGTCVPFKLN